MKTRYSIRLATGIAAAIILFVDTARAQNYSINWFKISVGGGASSTGNFSISGTIGQPDAGAMAGGKYGISGGFWGLYVVVQSSGAPVLSLANVPGGVVILWDPGVTGYRLEVSPALGFAANWQPVAGVINNSSTQHIAPGARFYRLISP